MSYLLGLVVVGILFMALHYFTELNHFQKTVIALLVVGVIGGAYGYNQYSDAQQAHVREIILHYEQGKTIVCDDINVSAENFSFSVGTQIFIGREGTAHFGRMFSAAKCH
jgi:predicted negative regulator of RcsB-dependent stress response